MEPPDSAWLETVQGDTLPIKGTCSIGRGPENSVVLTAEKVSRRHALIHAQNETEFWLVDLGSRNGTFRNAARVRQPTKLEPNDTIEIGPIRFNFRMEAKGAAPASDKTATETVVTKRPTEVWLFIIDLIDFSQLCQLLPPDDLAQRLGSWLLHCAEVVERSGGCVDKYVGDGFVGYWPVENVPESKLASALREIESLRGEGSTDFRWALHRAELQLGVSRFGNESLIGPEINFIHRMEKLAGALNVERLISEPAADRLRSSLPTRSVGKHSVKGFERERAFYTLA